MRNKNRKHILLSVVALLLVTLMAVGVTYSWIDDLKLVEFQNDNISDNKAPLKAGVDINSDVVISQSESVIDLGNMLYSDKTNIMYSENDAYHVRYDTNNDNADKEPNWANIQQKKGYFYESGDMHLSGCYGDGENFYFPLGSGSGGFREGNKDDENVNYISMTMKVSSPDAGVDFWFPESDTPYVCMHGDTGTKSNKARFSLSVDGKTHVYYPESGSAPLTRNPANLNQTVPIENARTIEAYTYYSSGSDNRNKSDERGFNGNTLFSIKKGGTVTLTVKIWLESGFENFANGVDVHFKLMSSWGATRTITVKDKTTALSASSWIGNDSAKMYLTLPAVLMEINNEVAKTDNDYSANSTARWHTLKNRTGYEYAPFFELTKVSGTTDTYTVPVPLSFNNQNMVIYRCTSGGWNSEDKGTGDAPKKRGPEKYKVYCWNWWESYLPDTFQDETYTIYGSSYDKVATDVFGGDETNKGYGTWGAVEEITFDALTKSLSSSGVYGGGNNLATKNGRVFVRDYSDYSTSGEIHTYVMRSLSPDSSDNGKFSVYVPVSSNAIQFCGYWSADNNVFWAYKSWSGDNPQLRPVGSVTYYATQIKDKKGLGFWDGADDVYLIKNGTLYNDSITTLRVRLYDSSPSGSTDTGRTNMTLVSGVTYGDEGHEYTVYKNNPANANRTPGHYLHVEFDNGSTGDGNVSGEKVVFAGCYFDWGKNRWLGALTAGERGGGSEDSGGDSGSGGSGGDSGGGGATPATTTILTAEPSEDGIYLFGKLSGGSAENEYAKFDSDSSGGKVVLSLEGGKYYSIKVKKKNGNTWTTYANGDAVEKSLSLGATQSEWNVSTGNSEFIGFRPIENGTFTVTLGNLDNNTQKIGWKFE